MGAGVKEREAAKRPAAAGGRTIAQKSKMEKAMWRRLPLDSLARI